MKNIFLNGNQKAFESFKEQYGTNNFKILTEKLLENDETLTLFKNTDLINTPTEEQVLNAVMKIEYVNIITYCHDFSASELEKKNDYLFFSSIIILNEWAVNYLPHIINNTSNIEHIDILEKSVWLKLKDSIKRLYEIYDELEQNYK